MTMHKVDLSKPTQMPSISSSMDPVIKALKGSSVRLTVQVLGEPAPKVSWQRDCVSVDTFSDVSAHEDNNGVCHVDIDAVTEETEGKYTITAANTAGRTTKSIQVQMVDNQQVFEAYKKFEK